MSSSSDIFNWVNAIITIVACALSAFVTVRILIAELKKDVENMKTQMDDTKADIKEIRTNTTESRIQLANLVGFKEGLQTTPK